MKRPETSWPSPGTIAEHAAVKTRAAVGWVGASALSRERDAGVGSLTGP